jgi:hypothetical protein
MLVIQLGKLNIKVFDLFYVIDNVQMINIGLNLMYKNENFIFKKIL